MADAVLCLADPNLVSIPKSVTPERIEQNFDVEHWQLSDESMEKLTALDSDFRYFISCASAEPPSPARGLSPAHGLCARRPEEAGQRHQVARRRRGEGRR